MGTFRVIPLSHNTGTAAAQLGRKPAASQPHPTNTTCILPSLTKKVSLNSALAADRVGNHALAAQHYRAVLSFLQPQEQRLREDGMVRVRSESDPLLLELIRNPPLPPLEAAGRRCGHAAL